MAEWEDRVVRLEQLEEDRRAIRYNQLSQGVGLGAAVAITAIIGFIIFLLRS
ncbi:MAG: hypothetical protein AAB932_01660 [Patescibacteria group bacterium]